MLAIRLAGYFTIYLEILRNAFLVPGKSLIESRTPAHMERQVSHVHSCTLAFGRAVPLSQLCHDFAG